jgi:hypothetical protein
MTKTQLQLQQPLDEKKKRIVRDVLFRGSLNDCNCHGGGHESHATFIRLIDNDSCW